MTLSERFAMYQRKAAEVEMMKPRKSPEIHRYLKCFIISSEVIEKNIAIMHSVLSHYLLTLELFVLS